MPINDLPDDLMELARRIADGEDVNWAGMERSTEHRQPALRQLEAIDRIRRGHSEFVRSELPFETWGPLDLHEHLASGGFGEVFLARDRNLDRPVALKLLYEDDDRNSRTGFIEEARRLAQVDHPNVVTVHGVDRFEGRLGIWMERIEGETLEHWVERHGTLSAKETAVIGIDLCRALAAIHAKGLIHGDVKLSNVMRALGGRIVLMDFGSSSRRPTSGSGGDTLSGTRAYLSPEVLRGKPADERSDLFAVGVLLYRVVGGSYPFPFDTKGQRHDHASFLPLLDLQPDLPEGLVRIVERVLNPAPDRRFASAGELERALAGFLGPAETANTAGRQHPKTAASNRLWIVAPILALVAIVAMLAGRAWLTPLDVDAEFFRLNSIGTEERLRSGAQTQPGDSLFLDLQTESRAWAYVITADAFGEEYLLFPVPGLDVTNPLPAGQHRIPGSVAAKARYWEVTSDGGQESLLLIVSRTPVTILEEMIAELQSSAPGMPIPMSSWNRPDRMRGIGGLNEGPDSGVDSDGPLAELQRRIRGDSDGQRDLRIWELMLNHDRDSP